MSSTESIPVQLTVFGGTLRASIPVTTQPVRSQDMLPAFQAVAEAVIHLSVVAVEKQGRSISCRAGCGACCRQFVPISETEARVLIDLVNAMPEPRRGEMMERFAAAAREIDRAGLRDPLLAPESQPAERLKRVGMEYFALGIACPFLEEEFCSIHPLRPIICREYLVTSPPENCSTLKDVDGVPVPYHASLAACRLDEAPSQTLVRTVPLTMIFEWAKTAAPEPAPRPGTDLMREFLRYLDKSAR